MTDKLLAIGWDAAGMLGDSQALAVFEADKNTLEWEFHGTAKFSFKNKYMGSFPVPFDHLLKHALYDKIGRAYKKDSEKIIAIDAPFAFPEPFKNHINDWPDLEKSNVLMDSEGDIAIDKLAGKIYEPLGFRDIDLYVRDRFADKFKNNSRPFSPVYSMITNQALLVRMHMKFWNCTIQPIREEKKTGPTAIEVYPKLVKEKGEGDATVKKRFKKFINNKKTDLELGTDEYDAAICALHALAFGMGNRWCKENNLPDLVGYEEITSTDDDEPEFPREEGWIYHFLPEN